MVIAALFSFATFLLLVSSAPGDGGTLRRDAEFVSLSISPTEIQIGGANRHQQIVVTALDSAGKPFDVTRQCRFEVENSSVARSEESLIMGVSDGRTEIRVSIGQLEQRAAIVVQGFDDYPPVNFANDVIPLFSKLGCNGGGCHGKQSGQNGFKLSVFGFDPRADYEALVKEGRGRRVFPGDPMRSLLFAKATGRVPHGGGRRVELDSSDAELLEQWVRQGMPWGDDSAPQLTGLRIEPLDCVMDVRSDQQVLVTALYSDGSARDVTSAASFTTNADVVADADEHGLIRTGRVPGEAAITINYMGQVGAVRIIVPRPNGPEEFHDPQLNNHIDQLVWAKLKKLNIAPSEPADDATFLRRVYVHSIGTLPTPDEVRDFLADSDPDKRRRLIDEVLERDEYADYWSLKWADILLVDQKALGARGALEFHLWLREQFAANRPYDEWVAELLTATGNSGKYGPVNFYRAMRTPEDLAKSVSQALLGVRLDCAQCHHHPFDRWGQEDFYGMAGYFNGLQYKSFADGRELIYHAGYRETKLPLHDTVVATRPPGGDSLQDLASSDPRTHLAQWVTDADNPYFARVAVNRLWKHFLGRGLVEPEDDLRSTNPATNEPLLDYLAEQLVANDFDLKAVMRLIMNSRVYQLSSQPNESNFDDEQNYSHFIVKRLPAEVLLDAISEVTGSPEHFPGMPRGTRAIELWDNRLPSYFLDTFGRSERQSPCECGKSGEPTMSQALHLMNAPEIEMKIADPSGRVAKLIGNGASRDEIVEQLCLAALGRMPTDKENAVAAELFDGRPQRQAAEDFLWALLNSYDFLFVK